MIDFNELLKEEPNDWKTKRGWKIGPWFQYDSHNFKDEWTYRGIIPGIKASVTFNKLREWFARKPGK